jgi:hypothetical protein
MSAANKERSSSSAQYPVVETGRFPDVSTETAGYIEKVEKDDHNLTCPVQDDQTGQVLVTSPQAERPKIVLPLTMIEYQAGFGKSIESAWRWLSEWSKRVRKMLGAQVDFKSET